MDCYNFSKVTRVEELVQKDKVNQYLDLGWKILTAVPRRDDVLYSLGWEGPDDPKFPKTPDPSLFGRQG